MSSYHDQNPPRRSARLRTQEWKPDSENLNRTLSQLVRRMKSWAAGAADRGDDGDATVPSVPDVVPAALKDFAARACRSARRGPSAAEYSVRRGSAVAHVRQRDDWDCGIGCMQMAVRWLRRDRGGGNDGDGTWGGTLPLDAREETERDWLAGDIGTKSIWTVELLWALHRFLATDVSLRGAAAAGTGDPRAGGHDGSAGIFLLFCSLRLGVDDSYGKYSFYKNNYSVDAERVGCAFRNAFASVLPMCSAQLSVDALAGLVACGDCVAIVLLDNRILRDGLAAADGDRDDFPPSSYVGHYVLLCGVSSDPRDVARAREIGGEGWKDGNAFCLVLKNPGIDAPVQFVMPRHFERCRSAPGTDEDSILIFMGDP